MINLFTSYGEEAMEEIKQEIANLRKEIKKDRIAAMAFIQVIVDRIEGITQELKAGWGNATIDSENISTDISKIKADIEEIKKEMNDPSKPDPHVSAETAKKFANDMKQYRSDLIKFQADFPGDKFPDKGGNIKNLINDLSKQLSSILNTSLVKGGPTIGDLIDSKDPKALAELQDMLGKLGKIPKNSINLANDDSKKAPIDIWIDGSDESRGLDMLDTLTDQVKTEGQRNLNKYETMITSLNNIGSNCVKNMNDGMQVMVNNQRAS